MVKHSLAPPLEILPEPSVVSWDTPPGEEAGSTYTTAFKCTGPLTKIVLVSLGYEDANANDQQRGRRNIMSETVKQRYR